MKGMLSNNSIKGIIMEENEQKENKKHIIIIIVSIFFIISILSVILGYKIWKDVKNGNNTKEVSVENVIQEQNIIIDKKEVTKKKEANIFKGTDRPIAVMIDNHSGAWPQSGLNNAYLVYEIIVEGGETRLMALFKGQNLDEIGPIRSSRHYFLDYVLENDAIYVHYGWSPKAKEDISKLSINNINGIFYGTPNFTRLKTKKAPHNAVTSTKKIMSMAKDLKYKTTSDKESVLKYSEKDINLNKGISAESVNIKHSYLHNVKYEYNSKTKKYTRYARGKIQKDSTTKEEITTKNIIIEIVKNSELKDGTNKDRQNLSNIGIFDGYYITNGKAIKIRCNKKSRESKTVYKDLDGKEIDVNDGNTWINFCSDIKNVTIK